MFWVNGDPLETDHRDGLQAFTIVFTKTAYIHGHPQDSAYSARRACSGPQGCPAVRPPGSAAAQPGELVNDAAEVIRQAAPDVRPGRLAAQHRQPHAAGVQRHAGVVPKLRRNQRAIFPLHPSPRQFVERSADVLLGVAQRCLADGIRQSLRQTAAQEPVEQVGLRHVAPTCCTYPPGPTPRGQPRRAVPERVWREGRADGLVGVSRGTPAQRRTRGENRRN